MSGSKNRIRMIRLAILKEWQGNIPRLDERRDANESPLEKFVTAN